MQGLLDLALALVLLQPAPPVAPPPPPPPPAPVVPPPLIPPPVIPPPVVPKVTEPLTEPRLLEIERKVENIQREFWDNGILMEERLGAAIDQADRHAGQPVEIVARVVRVDGERVLVRFFRDLGDLQGPLIEFLEKPGGAYLGGTRRAPALVVGTPSLPLEFARTLRQNDLLRLRGALLSIELAPRDEPPRADGSRAQRAVRVVISAPRIEKVEEAPQPAVPAPLPQAPLPSTPPLPVPLPIPPLPPPPAVR